MGNEAFSLIEERELSEVGGVARLWKHKASGAQLLSVCNKDENKCFGVTLRTPPKDSTGVAHILEHSVLCGSDKYPVKEPFVSLLKGSVQTFLNAFTFPDKTCYPVASANLQDFYNLIDVYIDAVFHPSITENTFRQEGWHMEAESAEGPWSYKGVVFNEMKGVYSSPDSMLGEKSQQSIYPDTLYSLDSGGEPSVIPTLTYKEFKAFHERYYNPSNARFFFWGDDPEERRLEIVDAAARSCPTLPPADSAIALQPAFKEPRQVRLPFSATQEDAKALFSVNWLLGERKDVEESLVLEMLEYMLEGMPSSPLRHALISSGLGEDTAGCGLETELRQMFYSTGLKGIDEKDIPKAKELIFSTLAKIAKEGFAPEAVEAAINTTEFSYRENNYGSFPQGLGAMLLALASWLYDQSPFDTLAWEKPLASVKARLASGEKVFENAIQKWFLDNPSRSTVVLYPDQGLARRLEEEEAKRAEDVRLACTKQEREEMVAMTSALQKAQLEPDSPEALATIPNLAPCDMPRENTPVPTSEERKEQGDVYFTHELPTKGIAYASVLLPMPPIPARLLPLLPLFGKLVRDNGSAKHTHAELDSLIAAKTGGVSVATSVVAGEGGAAKLFFSFGGKAVYDKLDDLFGIFEEILLQPCTDTDRTFSRMKEILLESKARLEQGLLSAGHSTVSGRICSRYTKDAVIAEALSGIPYLRHVRGMLDRFESEKSQLLSGIEELRRMLLCARGAVVNVTAEPNGAQAACLSASKLLANLPRKPICPGTQHYPLVPSCEGEYFLTPSQVCYVGKGCNLYQLGCGFRGSDYVILRHLKMGYLWENVRVKGGAYGASCSFGRVTGNFICTSYRDPNTEATVKAYDGMADYLATTRIGKDELDRAIVGAIGDMDAYQLPDAKGASALRRWLSGDTEERRQQMREEILSTTPEDFSRFADVLALARDKGIVSVVGGVKGAEDAKRLGWKCKNLF